METNFELKNISTEKETEQNRYVLNFVSGQTEKNITLAGLGSIKEIVKI